MIRPAWRRALRLQAESRKRRPGVRAPDDSASKMQDRPGRDGRGSGKAVVVRVCECARQESNLRPAGSFHPDTDENRATTGILAGLARRRKGRNDQNRSPMCSQNAVAENLSTVDTGE